MEFHEVLRTRHMVRAYERRSVDRTVLDRVVGAGLRGPAAGNTAGIDLVVLEGHEQTARYWDVCLPPTQRAEFRWPGLLDAPALVIPFAHEQAYLERYAEPDKAGSGLGEGADRWPVPYWIVDTSMAAMAILLAATDEGLGALFFGIFHHERELLESLGVPAGHTPIGVIALGHPAPDEPSASLRRGRPTIDEAVHRGRW